MNEDLLKSLFLIVFLQLFTIGWIGCQGVVLGRIEKKLKNRKGSLGLLEEGTHKGGRGTKPKTKRPAMLNRPIRAVSGKGNITEKEARIAVKKVLKKERGVR